MKQKKNHYLRQDQYSQQPFNLNFPHFGLIINLMVRILEKKRPDYLAFCKETCNFV